ncbi:hypothetical protein ACFMQL_20435 [Nonomuraea fastidiosa]|uniref:hypothetical protein n=1 Tax=Nonomuraea fastidiosa TaxID=46173 RepID=UPI00366E4444
MPRSSSVLDKSAWVHHCGAINLGTWAKMVACGGCRVPVESSADVEQYRLVRTW